MSRDDAERSAEGVSEAAGTPAAPELPGVGLTADEVQRYSRHLIMPEVGLEGQRALRAARVLLVGAGGLGAPLAQYLAAAGIGTLGIVDPDRVDLSNLQRQVIHGSADLGRPKTDSAADAIRDLNPHVRVLRHPVLLSSENALEILAGYDIVVDGTDNFPTRYLVNDACVLLGTPNVYGSVYRFDGQATVFAHRDGPCYRCLFPEPPPPGTVPSCAEAGVLGILPGIVGLIQATEVVKLVLGAGEPLVGRLLLYDALGMSFKELRIRRDPDCPVCGDEPTLTELIDYQAFCGLPARDEEDAAPAFEDEIEPSELQALLAGDASPVLIDVREPHERLINRIPGALALPLGSLPGALEQLDPQAVTVVHCLSGARSARACRLLQEAGFARVRNLRGGIRAWIAEVDPDMPVY